MPLTRRGFPGSGPNPAAVSGTAPRPATGAETVSPGSGSVAHRAREAVLDVGGSITEGPELSL